MRVAFLVPGGVDRSGDYRIIPALLALLRRLAHVHDVQVIALRQESAPGEWPLVGAHIHNIGSRLTRTRAVRSILTLNAVSRFDLIHAIWSGSCSLIAVAAGRLLGIPSLVHVAGGELIALPEIDYGGALTLRGRLRERLTLRAASAVTAASAPIVAAIATLGVTAHRVPLGVDLTMWPPRAPVRRHPSETVRLIHVASLNRVKDQPTLLRALHRLVQTGMDFHMDIVGEDTRAGEVQALAQELGLGARVRFHGFLPQRLLRPLIEAAHLMVISSQHETGPLVALEAAVAGVPTVGTAVGHLVEWAPEAAEVAPVGDSSALAKAIGGLVADEERRLRLANEASRRAIAENADHTAQCFEVIYQMLTADTGTRQQ